jgi:hypothetical protein
MIAFETHGVVTSPAPFYLMDPAVDINQRSKSSGGSFATSRRSKSLHSGIEFGRSRTGEGSSGGRKRGVV